MTTFAAQACNLRSSPRHFCSSPLLERMQSWKCTFAPRFPPKHLSVMFSKISCLCRSHVCIACTSRKQCDPGFLQAFSASINRVRSLSTIWQKHRERVHHFRKSFSKATTAAATTTTTTTTTILLLLLPSSLLSCRTGQLIFVPVFLFSLEKIAYLREVRLKFST